MIYNTQMSHIEEVRSKSIFGWGSFIINSAAWHRDEQLVALLRCTKAQVAFPLENARGCVDLRLHKKQHNPKVCLVFNFSPFPVRLSQFLQLTFLTILSRLQASLSYFFLPHFLLLVNFPLICFNTALYGSNVKSFSPQYLSCL